MKKYNEGDVVYFISSSVFVIIVDITDKGESIDATLHKLLFFIKGKR